MAESVPCEGEERQGLGSSGLRENRLSLKPINIPMGGSDEGDDGKGRRAVLEARLECMISSKGLGCSKAFEGRMRARLDDQGDRDSNKNKTWNLKNGSEEAKCPVCSKSFHSKKAMHGHMRCHPQREWRGINPPPSTKTASCSSASQEIDGLSHASMTSTVVSSDISPSEPPLQWTKTGRRGQNRIINSYSSSGSSCNISSSQNEGIVEKHQVSERAGQALTMGNKYASSSHTAASEEEGQALGTSKHAKQVVQKSHKCRTCNKSFPTGQSLGGHQTTHRRKPAQLAAPKQEASQNAGPRVLDFDLNELPPMEKE